MSYLELNINVLSIILFYPFLDRNLHRVKYTNLQCIILRDFEPTSNKLVWGGGRQLMLAMARGLNSSSSGLFVGHVNVFIVCGWLGVLQFNSVLTPVGCPTIQF